MKTVKRLLSEKGSQAWTTTPDATIFEALQLMADKDIGALPVIEEGKLVGIFTERDYARKVILREKTSRDTPIRQVMTAPVITIQPHQTMLECMALLAQYRIRHLPVMRNDQVVGVVSIGDVLQEIIEEQRQQIQRLENTMFGTNLLD